MTRFTIAPRSTQLLPSGETPIPRARVFQLDAPAFKPEEHGQRCFLTKDLQICIEYTKNHEGHVDSPRLLHNGSIKDSADERPEETTQNHSIELGKGHARQNSASEREHPELLSKDRKA